MGEVCFGFFKSSPNNYRTRLYIRVSDHALLFFFVLVFTLSFDDAFKTTLCLLVVIRCMCLLLEVLYFLHFFSSRDRSMGIWSQILCLKNQSYAFSAGVVTIFIEFESILKRKISWRNDSGSIV